MITRRLAGLWKRLRFVSIAVLATGCSREGPRSSPATPLAEQEAIAGHRVERLAGCFALFDHRGRPASDSLYNAPSHVRLEATPTSETGATRGSDQRRRLVKLDAAGRATGPEPWEAFQVWVGSAASDSVRLMFGTGFSGTEMILRPNAGADTLRGRAVEHWDFAPDSDGGSVTAIRVPCAESPGA